MNFILLLAPPLLAAALALAVRPYRMFVGWINALLSLVPLGAALRFAAHAIAGGEAPTFGPGEMLRVDSLSALLLLCISAVASLTLLLSPGLGGESVYSARQLRRYHYSINLFIAAMLLAVSANNVGILWIGVEATTIFSAFIVPLTLTQVSVEASWKYILISSVGIALAFTGTVLGYFDFVALSGRSENALNWPVLLESAPRLHPEVMQLAFIFILIGYGTKAGIAPMHTWKPDAYGEAPAPLGALMSSALFAVAMYAIARWKVVADAALQSRFTDTLLMALGLLSLIIAAFSIVLTNNYKRMLAYSSIEHTGLICLGLALGPLGAFAAMLHLVNHTAAKAGMFLLAGHVERQYGSPLIDNVRGLLKAMPWTGALFAATLLMLIGLPPGGIFISEFALFRAGFALEHPWLMAAALALLTIVFVSFISHLNKMLYGEPKNGVAAGDVRHWQIAPLFLCLAVLVTLGLTQPAPLTTLLNQIVTIIAR
ncbi:MAG: proton-conducting transporter membrane subunit [candidate division KSB1 bacterium]|nr:proton-conducting transporter membrane subunit [candidate division KSB1 bacterium]MDZ7274317.1 proton-conducting transporter membrane subunit [candidate division KSB1 bacterium]MDZ7287161.1 proton-conducting transporter membrane subunit [candidate division KSB1 bacterium]MDZ7296914.1 proton-conducting transporter membrane subunit [candidate division KSB1 bacterium]MDZ7307867.1 proton-conducting transporter membrane subunit [candidate division KSB1 bacterium]